MNRRLQKSWILSSMLLLGMNATLPMVHTVFAETAPETQQVEAEELTLPYDHLLEAPEDSAEENPQPREEAPTFSFEQKEMRGTVGKTTEVVIQVDRGIDQVQVTIPEEVIVQLEELPDGMEASQITETQWWLSAKEQTTFILPVTSETAGSFTIVVEDEVEGSVVFEEPLVELETEEEPTIDSGTFEEEDFVEDTATPEVQEDEESKEQEAEEITPATTSNVSTWAQFRTAINTNSVTVINVLADISGNTSLNDITRNLTINGNGFTINTQSRNIQIGSGNRILRVNDVTFINSLASSASQIRSRYQNTGATIRLSNVNYNSSCRLVGSAANYTGFHVVFDGGVSRMSGGVESVVMSANSVTLTNNAQVIVQNRPFYNNVGTITAAHANSQILQIDEGSKLSINGSYLGVATTLIDGDLLVTNAGSVIVGGTMQTGVQRITIGSTASVNLRRTSSGPVLTTNLDKQITVANGAELNISALSDSSILSDATNRTTQFILDARRFSVWNRGIENDDDSPSSNSFRNLQFRAEGNNASVLNSANNNAFASIYPQQGLAGYSRIRTEGKRVGSPLDPLDPDKEVDPDNPPAIPENQGDFRIDFVSQFSFGSQERKIFEEGRYTALPQYILDENGDILEEEPKPNYVQITDNRADADGWQLSVTQKEQFETETGSQLSGASIQLKNRQLVANHEGEKPREVTTDEVITLEPDEKQPLLTSANGEGKGTWIYRFGDGTSSDQSVVLVVPKETIPEIATYRTQLIWELSAVPINE